MARLHWRAMDRSFCSKKYKRKTRTVSSALAAGTVNSTLCWFYYELVYGEGSIRLGFVAEREGRRSPQLRRYALSMAPTFVQVSRAAHTQRWVVSACLEPLSCRKIAEGKDTKDSHNAQHGCPSKRIVKPLE